MYKRSLIVMAAAMTVCGAAAGQINPMSSRARSQSNNPSSSSAEATFLYGKVVLDDGTKPPDPVTIETLCGGARRGEIYTDLEGRFGFQLGNPDLTPQAGDANPLGVMNGDQAYGMGDCELRPILPGFTSNSVYLGLGRSFGDGNLGTIVLHRMTEVAGSAVSVTSLQVPKAALNAYQKAIRNLRKNKPTEAAKDLQKAVDLYPNYASAWYALGRIQEENQDSAQARESFSKAISADGRFVSPYANMAEIEAKAGNWAQTAEITDRLLKLNSVDFPMAYFYNAFANMKLRQFDAAEKSARDGEKLGTPRAYPQLEEVLGVVLAMKKDYSGAAAHIRSYLAMAPAADDAARAKQEVAEFDRLASAGAERGKLHQN